MKAVGYVERESTGIELIDEGLVEFVVSIDAVDPLMAKAVILSLSGHGAEQERT